MSIKSCFKKIVDELESCLSTNDGVKNKINIILCVKKTWTNLRVFIKDIDPKSTKYYDELLTNVEDDLIITEEMFKEASRDITSLKNEINNVRLFIYTYFNLLEKLLIFNRDNVEACEVCQGSLLYYFDEVHQSIIISCKTCGSIFTSENGKFIKWSKDYNFELRRAQKGMLLSLLNEFDIEI